jgi:hypothetical protein
MDENLKLCISDKFDMDRITVDIINKKFCTEYNKQPQNGNNNMCRVLSNNKKLTPPVD